MLNKQQPGGVVCMRKLHGETPLEALHRLKNSDVGLKNSILSYAGRLDPMAEGLLLVLVNEENKKREAYLHLEKTYEVEILFGISTDTGDVLGMVKEAAPRAVSAETARGALSRFLPSFLGKQQQRYPAYSSRTVNGVPLHSLARQNKLPQDLPRHEVEFFDLSLLGMHTIASPELLKYVLDSVALVHGDFRQSEISARWRDVPQNSDKTYVVARIRVHSSGGAYMRVLAEDIGTKIGLPAIVYSILRTNIGTYSLNDCLL